MVAAGAILGLGVVAGWPPAVAARDRVPFALDLPPAPVRFTWSSPLAQVNDLYAVKGTPDGARIWAVGATGTIVSLRGTQATLEASGTVADLYDLFVVAENDIWVVGERGTILHGDGKRWSPVRSGTKQALYSIWGRSAQDLWIGGNDGTILRRDGARWRATPSPTKGPITGIAGCGPGVTCVLTLASLLPAIDLSDRPCTDPDGECLADEPAEPEGTRILRWSDGRWSPTFLGLGYAEAHRLVPAGSALLVSEDQILSIVHVGGKLDDQRVTLASDVHAVFLHGAWAGSEADGWLVGERCTQQRPGADLTCDRGAIWRFDGRSTSLRPEIPGSPLRGVWAWSKTGAIAVGNRGTIMRFDGAAWTAVSQPLTTADLRGVWSGPPAAAGNSGGPISLRAADAGAQRRIAEVTLPAGSKMTWGSPRLGGGRAQASAGDTKPWLVGDCEALQPADRAWIALPTRDCQARAATRKIVAVDPGDVWISPSDSGSWGALEHWDGKAWTNVRVPSGGTPRDLSATARDDVWIIAGPDVFHWDGRALAAAAPVPGLQKQDQLAAVWASDAKNVWVAATSGSGVKLSRWDGERWLPSASFRLDLPRRYFPSDSSLAATIWRPTHFESYEVTLWGTSPTDVWLAGPNGIVLRFDGNRWSRVATPTRYPLFGLGGTPQRVVAVGAAGTVLQLDLSAPERAAAH